MKDELQIVHQRCRRIETSLDTECQDASETVFKIFYCQFMVRTAGKTCIIHTFH